jgi:hypothetical protein
MISVVVRRSDMAPFSRNGTERRGCSRIVGQPEVGHERDLGGHASGLAIAGDKSPSNQGGPLLAAIVRFSAAIDMVDVHVPDVSRESIIATRW